MRLPRSLCCYADLGPSVTCTLHSPAPTSPIGACPAFVPSLSGAGRTFSLAPPARLTSTILMKSVRTRQIPYLGYLEYSTVHTYHSSSPLLQPKSRASDKQAHRLLVTRACDGMMGGSLTEAALQIRVRRCTRMFPDARTCNRKIACIILLLRGWWSRSSDACIQQQPRYARVADPWRCSSGQNPPPGGSYARLVLHDAGPSSAPATSYPTSHFLARPPLASQAALNQTCRIDPGVWVRTLQHK